jgi:hypothetical protein
VFTSHCGISSAKGLTHKDCSPSHRESARRCASAV